MKKIMLLSIVLNISLLVSHAGYWERTYYDGPLQDVSWGESDFLWDGEFYYETNVTIRVSFSVSIYAFCDIEGYLYQRNPPPVGAEINSTNWLEIYGSIKKSVGKKEG